MEVTLTVEEALRTDIGRQLARIPQDVAQQLEVKTGDVISIQGARTSYAKVWKAHPKDVGVTSIRLDPTIRENVGVFLQGKVTIRKVKVSVAKKVHLQLGTDIEMTEKFIEFVQKALVDKLVTQGDSLALSVGFGKTLRFKIASAEPQGCLIVAPSTTISVTSEHDELDTSKSKSSLEESESSPSISYEEIGGLDDAIQKIREMVELPLKYPQLFEKLGIQPPNGVLLYGPPGTGKTLLAKAVASETSSHFSSINGPEIVSRFYGESENKLREIFDQAAKHQSAIIFIDEIDSIAPKRSGDTGEAERRIVSQLLTLMDGMNTRSNVVVIAATNRPDSIDEALRRGGRFDREIEIGIPDQEGRLGILQILTRGVPLDPKVDLSTLASQTFGYVGADLSTLVKEAALISLRRLLPQLDFSSPDPLSIDFLDSLQVIPQDFERAISEVSPSAMREVFTEKPNNSWDDIGGYSDLKEFLRELIVWPLEHPELYEETDTTPVKGILLYGPPGTGKTLFARTLSAEAGVNFISIRGPELLNRYVGETEKALREVFRKARAAAPSIIFFDEIDAMINRRDRTSTPGGSSIISQLLVEMDAINPKSPIFILAATNRPDVLDPALRRPGRFDQIVYIGYPTEEDRKAILELQFRKIALSSAVNIEDLVRQTSNYSGSELQALVSEAKRNLLKRLIVTPETSRELQLSDLEAAFEKVSPSKLEYSLSPPKMGGLNIEYDYK